MLLCNTQARVIMDRMGLLPYLSRYYVFGAPKMADGSPPFDKYGNLNPGERARINPTFDYGLYVHHFHKSDDDGAPHSHPFKWGLSFVIAGGYYEERLIGDRIVRRKVPPLSFNFLNEKDFHRVDLIEEDAWTLFLVGPRVQSWFFWDRTTKKSIHWREFLAQGRN